MPHTHLHIISFDVPYPPNYGGVIDVFYKIKSLHEEGVKIHLHCFEYGRAEARLLESFCEQVYYYKRSMKKRFLINPLPYIVVTRQSEVLVNRLIRDNYPILFEGLHSCYHLPDARLAGRKKILRSHNIEHDYYTSLANVEKSFFRKTYFRGEATKLKRFEKVAGIADHVLAISIPDREELKKLYMHVEYVPAFHPNEKVEIRRGKGDFVLYHGNLEVGENNEAALFLVKNIFSENKIPFLIAGKNPSAELKAVVGKYPNITLKANITTSEIDELIRAAQINILPTFQATGIKLKLLAALFNGRHCIVNSPMVAHTGLESLCSVQDHVDSMKKEVERLFAITFDMSEKKRREQILYPAFSNKESVKKLIDIL